MAVLEDLRYLVGAVFIASSRCLFNFFKSAGGAIIRSRFSSSLFSGIMLSIAYSFSTTFSRIL